MNRPIVNLDELDPQPMPAPFAPTGDTAERYAGRIAPIGARIGMKQMGANLTVIGPGKRAFPFHNHHGNEELFIILDGRGELRFGPDRHPVRAGDIISCPSGGPEVAHQLINTGDTDMRYLAIATSRSPEVAEFPDTGKYAVLLDELLPVDGEKRLGRRTMGSLDVRPGYWDGE
jgi:uncharacterized cupin superfamily protein